MPSPAGRTFVLALPVALAFASAWFSDASFAADAPSGTASAAAAESWLIVLEAGKAEAKDGKLVLSGLPEKVLAFADRPARQVLRPDLGKLAALWNELFGDDSPNAALVWLGEGEAGAGESRDQVIELWQPLKRGATLEFSYRVLDAAPERLASIAKGGTPLPATMSKVSLYIDGVDLKPSALVGGGGGGLQCWPLMHTAYPPFTPCAKTMPEMSCACTSYTHLLCDSPPDIVCCRNSNLVDCETLCLTRPYNCIPNPDGT